PSARIGMGPGGYRLCCQGRGDRAASIAGPGQSRPACATPVRCGEAPWKTTGGLLLQKKWMHPACMDFSEMDACVMNPNFFWEGRPRPGDWRQIATMHAEARKGLASARVPAHGFAQPAAGSVRQGEAVADHDVDVPQPARVMSGSKCPEMQGLRP